MTSSDPLHDPIGMCDTPPMSLSPRARKPRWTNSEGLVACAECGHLMRPKPINGPGTISLCPDCVIPKRSPEDDHAE